MAGESRDKPVVLAVDDNDVNLMLIEAILTSTGTEVVLAHSGEEALAKAAQLDPDVILLDVMMPGIDGFETARRLKSDPATSLIPVVMVTALDEVQDRIRALEAGADDFLAKPVEIGELRARVKTLVQVKAYHEHMRDYQKKLEAEVEAKTRSLREATERIREAALETIMRLSAAAEYRDEETGLHIQRMSLYAAAIARRLGLPEERVRLIQAAAPMHDIGKIGIPDRILLKPGPLDDGEWAVMRQHPRIGAGILDHSDAAVIRLGEVIARCHHEKWDGSGYPRGLKGEEIPLEGRIVAVADVFDALTSSRPYRLEPFSPLDKVHAMMIEGRGKHFDPAVLDAFLAIPDTIREIMERVKDPVPPPQAP